MLATCSNYTKVFTRAAIAIGLALILLLPVFVKNQVYAAAGINRQINFQGKLVNNPNGTNVSNATYTIVFTIYDRDSGGSSLWTESQTVTTVDGVFRVALGSFNPFPTNFNFNWSGLYLGIKVNTDNEMSPRIQLAAVPFAFNAQQVAGLTVQDDNGNASTSGTLQVGNAKTINFKGSNGLTFNDPGAAVTITFPNTGSITLVDTETSQTLTNKIIGSGGLTFSGASTDITTATNEDFILSPNGSGKVGINTSTTLASIDIRGNPVTGGTLSIASVSGTTSFAALIVDNNGVGDIFTASKSGLGLFTVQNNGILKLGASTYQSCTLITGATGLVTCGGSNTANNWWNQLLGALSPINTTNDLLIGGSSTSSATFHVFGSLMGGTTPVASISANTSYAAMVIDQTGSGDLFTASRSGQTVFSILNSGTVYKNTASMSGNLILMPNKGWGGNLGIGTTTPGANIDISAGATNNNNVINATGSINDFLEMNVTNTSTGTGAQSGYSATADNGTLTSKFIWLGINNSNFYNPQAYNVGGPGDGTLLSLYNDLDIANGTSGKTIYFFTGGTNPSNRRMSIDGSGNVVVGSASALATFDVRGNSGTNGVASVSGTTSFATMIIDNNGVGDIITASKSGFGLFTVKNNGYLMPGINGTQNLGSLNMQWGNIYASGLYLPTTATYDGFWQRFSGAVVPTNITDDLLIGSSSTTSAEFSFTGLSLANHATQASMSGNLVLMPNYGYGGFLGIGVMNPGALIDISSPANSLYSDININNLGLGTGISLVSNSGGNASVIIKKTGNNDILTASNSGGTVFTITGGSTTSQTGASLSGQFVVMPNNGYGGNASIAGQFVLGAVNNATIQTTRNQGLTFGGNTTGNVTFLPGNGTGTLTIGTSTNGLTFDVTNGGPTYSGTARILKTITLSPEYAGAVLTASGSATTVGNMTSDASPSASWRTYYEWVGTGTGLNDYTVAVRVTLPADFSDWQPINAISFDYETASNAPSTNKIDLIIYNPSDPKPSTPVVMRTGLYSATGKTWYTLNIPASSLITGVAKWNTASQSATFYIKMYGSGGVNYAHIGDIDLNYLAKF